MQFRGVASVARNQCGVAARGLDEQVNLSGRPLPNLGVCDVGLPLSCGRVDIDVTDGLCGLAR
jgi:hypothetical protein